MSYCEAKDLREFPNCYAVRQVRAFERMTELPREEPDSFSLMMEPWDQDTTSNRRE